MNIFMINISEIEEKQRIDATYIQQWFAFLDKKRLDKIQRTAVAADQTRILAAGLLARYAVYQYTKNRRGDTEHAKQMQAIGAADAMYDDRKMEQTVAITLISIEQINAVLRETASYVFDTLPDGKPVIKNIPDVFFSLSHTGNYVICAVGYTPCGIDMEGNRPVKRSVARRFFSETENAWLAQAELNEEYDSRFFRLWVLKEAYAKYTGRGIAKEIQKAHFCYDKKSNRLLPDMEESVCCQELSYASYRIGIVLK